MKQVLIALALLLHAGSAFGGESNRTTIIARMREFLNVSLETSDPSEATCLSYNLRHPNLQVCSPTTSDILWHEDFLNGVYEFYAWAGMPYSYGGKYDPSAAQDAICACKSLGNHLCHYTGNGNDASWAVGVDCSGAVCYAGNVPDTNACGLASSGWGVQIAGWDCVPSASYLVKCDDQGKHVVLVESRDGLAVTVLEATGDYPVSRLKNTTYAEYSSYTYWNFKDVANAEGSDGLLIAIAISGAVELTWTVESAQDARWYQFQYWNQTDGIWITFDEQDYCGAGKYRSRCAVAGAEGLIYRVRENEWSGRRIPHSETMAMTAAN